MVASYLRRGMTGLATFSLFVRALPKQRGFLVAAGIESCLDYLQDLRFDEDEIRYLGDELKFPQRDLEAFRQFRFTGDVWGVPEGRVVFAGEPLLEVTAPLPEAQLIEAGLEVAGVSASAGLEARSNVEAARRYGLVAAGTMAHSYVQAFARERDAFLAFARDFPGRTTFLVDTYDTVSGIKDAIEVIRKLKLRGRTGVRLDSGNLLELTIRARRLLDAARLKHVRIFVSGGLDEFQIDDLVRGGAPIDAFGVGTRMGVSADQPYLDTAYKLVDYAGRPVMKLATGKVTAPGRKQVFRRRKPFGDVIGLFEETAPSGMEPLLQPMMVRGRRTSAPAGVTDSRALCEADIAELPGAVRRIKSPRGLIAQTTEKLQRTTEQTRERLLSRFGPKRNR